MAINAFYPLGGRLYQFLFILLFFISYSFLILLTKFRRTTVVMGLTCFYFCGRRDESHGQ